MEIRCRCGACQQKFKVDAKYAGKKARCPKCQQVVEVPVENLDASTTTTSLPALKASQPAASNSASSSAIVPPMPVAAAAAPAALPKPAPVAQAAPAPQPVPVAAEPTPAPQQPADPFGGFQISTKPAAKSVAAAKPAPASGAAPAAKKAKSGALPLVLGGGLLTVVLVVGGIAAAWALSQPASVAQGSGKSKGSSVSTGNSTMGVLILDWPDADPRQASISIDGRREPLTKGSEVKYTLTPGTHKVQIQRRGYETFETQVTLARGATQHVTPEWKTAETVALGPTPASGNVPTGTPGVPPGGFPIGTAVPVGTIRGFAGWLQSLDEAKQQAAAGQKDILVVFAISDVHPRTQQLAQLLARPEMQTKTAGMVKVVIDFPRTPTAREMVQDSAQNIQLSEEFCVDSFPALVLTDSAGKGYFFREQWEEGIQSVASKFEAWQAQRAERDQVLAAAAQGTPDEQLANAAKAVKWLQDHVVSQFFRPEVDTWLVLAQRADPDNQKKMLETFFETQWWLQAQLVNAQDPVAVGRLVGQLDPWATRKFQDHDRGAKLHLMAAHLLQQAKDMTRFEQHLQHAAHYQPKDSKLADSLKQLRFMLENKDIASNGTGYLISEAGYILTNNHVTDGSGAIVVRVPGTSNNVPAQLIAADPKRDIALIKVTLPDASKYKPLSISPDGLRRGSEVAAFGYPLVTSVGTGLKFTAGPVSALPDDTNDQMYLLDVTVNPGNSGGPLCDKRGNVVGMVTAKTGNFGYESSYGLAVPAADLVKFLDKHLPAGTPRPAPATGEANLGWDSVDERVSSGVLMILKKK